MRGKSSPDTVHVSRMKRYTERPDLNIESFSDETETEDELMPVSEEQSPNEPNDAGIPDDTEISEDTIIAEETEITEEEREHETSSDDDTVFEEVMDLSSESSTQPVSQPVVQPSRIPVPSGRKQYVTRSGRVSKPPPRLSLFLTMCTLALIVGQLDASFQHVNPVLWRKTNKSVIEGNQQVITTVSFQSPCSIFSDVNSPNSSLLNWCEDSFNENFLKPIQSMCSKPIKKSNSQVTISRNKRLVILTALLIGVVVISVFATIGISSWSLVKSFQASREIEDLKEQQNQMLVEIQQNRMNDASIKKVLYEMEGRLEVIDKQVRLLTTSMRELTQSLPETIREISNLATRFQIINHNLKIIKRSWEMKSVDYQFLELFNITLPCKETCPINLAHPKNCHIDDLRKLITFEFDLVIRRKSTIVLKSEAFDMVVKNGSKICHSSFIGPKLVVFDKENDCVRPIKGRYIEESDVILFPRGEECQESFLMNKSSAYWRNTYCEETDSKNNDESIQIKQIGEQNIIYCHLHNITIHSRTVNCPNSPFLVSTKTPFNIGKSYFSSKEIQLHSSLPFVDAWSQRVNFHLLPSISYFEQTPLDSKEILDEIGKINDNQLKIDHEENHKSVIAIVIMSIIIMILIIAFVMYRLRKLLHNRVEVNDIIGHEQEKNDEMELMEVKNKNKPRKSRRSSSKVLIVTALLFCANGVESCDLTRKTIALQINYNNPCSLVRNSSEVFNWCKSEFHEFFIEPIDKFCSALSTSSLKEEASIFAQRIKRYDFRENKSEIKDSSFSTQLKIGILSSKFETLRFMMAEIRTSWKKKLASEKLWNFLKIRKYEGCAELYEPFDCNHDPNCGTIKITYQRKFSMLEIKFLALIISLCSVLFLAIFLAIISRRPKKIRRAPGMSDLSRPFISAPTIN